MPGATAGTVRPFGDSALLVDVDGPEAARALSAAVRAEAWPGVVDVAGGFTSVVVTVEPRRVDPDALAEPLAALGADPPPLPPGRRVVLPASFDGEDLAEVAAAAGCSEEAVVEMLTAAELTVAVVGFSPGFAYLSGLPEPLQRVARRPAPRPSVPPGSVALAGGLAAVYPHATPGGWQLVGRTERTLFDPDHPPFSLLGPGDRVRFTPVDPAASGRRPAPARRRPWRVAGTAALAVEDPGLLSLVQDAGRTGVAHLGVSRAGPADPVSHRLANELVGSPADGACLEITARGPVLVSRSDLHVAVVGGDPRVEVDGREVPVGRVVPLGAGQRLVVGTTTDGWRAYLGVEGGLAPAPVLGSRATDTLAWIGPGPLVPGDELAVGHRHRPLGGHLPAHPGWPPPDGRPLRVLPGPDSGWFPPGEFERLAGARFAVEAPSNRVGVRLRPLDGAGPSRRPGELASHPMVLGAIQVPPAGHPVVLGPDHATLGGYPVLAVVIAADRAVLGQCRPGDEVRLVPVGAEEAAAALGRLERLLADAVRGRYPVVSG